MGLSNYVPSSRVSQAGVCTSTTRPASPYEGQMIYETDTNRVLVYDNTAWVMIADTDSPPGLELVGKYTFTSSGTWQCTSAFSSTYENYRLVVNCTSAAGTAAQIQVTLLVGTTATATNYYNYYRGITWGGSNDVTTGDNVTNWFAMRSNASPWSGVMDIHHPQLAQKTFYSSQGADTNQQWQSGGYQNSSTQFDGIQIASSGSFSMTGTVRVYGYRN